MKGALAACVGCVIGFAFGGPFGAVIGAAVGYGLSTKMGGFPHAQQRSPPRSRGSEDSESHPGGHDVDEQAPRQIGYVVERGPIIWIYDIGGKRLGFIFAGDALVGYTSNRVTVRRGPLIVVYDERGRHVATRLA